MRLEMKILLFHLEAVLTAEVMVAVSVISVPL